VAAAAAEVGFAAGLPVARVDGAFFGACEDGDDAAEVGRGAELREEVYGEAQARVVGYGEGEVQAFFGFCGRWIVLAFQFGSFTRRAAGLTVET
jgi:hypothetical protein